MFGQTVFILTSTVEPFQENEPYTSVHLVTEDDFYGHQGHDLFDHLNAEELR
jgi:hypothetical protein